MMRWALVGLLIVHGLVHLLGFAKAFGYAELPQLTQSISREWGVLWLLTSGLIIATAVMFAVDVRAFWIAGGLAVLVSQMLIITTWRDAWAGTAANTVLLLVVVHGLLTEGPWSFHAQYLHDVGTGVSRSVQPSLVTEADLIPLPEPVRRYLRVTRAVGQPRVSNYRVSFDGRIRRAPAAAWMPFEAEQQSFADEPTRLFLMRARMFGIPVEAFHRLVGGHATMRVKVAGVVRMADESGAEMDRAETVTLFNDMCLLAPGALLDPHIAWEAVDATTARARFIHAGVTIGATLMFNGDGELINFVSDDRARSEAGGRFRPRRFSTPVRDYRDFGPIRIMSFGEARWLLPEGEFTYGEFNVVAVGYNVGDQRAARTGTLSQ